MQRPTAVLHLQFSGWLAQASQWQPNNGAQAWLWGAMSNITLTHCLANKTVWEAPWWSICFPLSSSYGGVKGHFTGIQVSFQNLLSASGQLFCWFLRWNLALLLVPRCIYLSTEAALAVSLHNIFSNTYCELVSSWTVNLFLREKKDLTKNGKK